MHIFVHYLLKVMQPCSGNLKTLHELGDEGCKATQNLITFSWDM